ncbi:hypothetical protein QBC38DRAFT_368905 [Podospora fimiseda]|uniref:Uncharacterized protein n=1 Tax=Podospora fimiseda TaxID=252190 RepID=A0AAN7GRN4_9PEZI|nr:hypothetical protein QBC38DRAFT_368905 [Podospora fimiseda]
MRLTTSLRPTASRAMPRLSFRPFSTSLPRAIAAETQPTDPRGGSPVDDMDVVFDYPSAAQGSPSKTSPSLESSGLGPGVYGGKYTGQGIDETIDSMKHSMGSMKEGVKDTMENMESKPMKRIDKEMGYPDNNFIYAGLGALGLGALYMTLREPPPSEEIRRRDPTVDARRTMRDAKHNYPAHAPLENKVEKMIGRTG